jgi:hypothetical protein
MIFTINYPTLFMAKIRNAPLNDPMEVEIEGYYISLRHAEWTPPISSAVST